MYLLCAHSPEYLQKVHICSESSYSASDGLDTFGGVGISDLGVIGCEATGFVSVSPFGALGQRPNHICLSGISCSKSGTERVY